MHTTPADTSIDTEQGLNCFLDSVLTTVSRTVYPELDLDVHHNASYEQPQLLDLLTHISLENAFANSGAKTRRIREGDRSVIRNDQRSPLAKALGYHLRDLDPSEIQTQFDAVLDEIKTHANRARLLTGAVDLAIDEHAWLFYGDDQTEMTTHTDPNQGTDRAFTFLTACVVSGDLRLTVGVEPLGPDTRIGEALVKLLGPVTPWLDIRRVFLDRGFYEVQVLQALEAFDLSYVVRARQFPSLASGLVDTIVEEGYEMSRSRPPYTSVTLTRFAVPHADQPDEKQTYFVTNMEVTEATAAALAESYRRRWGIETSYRVIGDFLAKTTSKSFVVRLYYFLFAVTLYDIWVLTNVLLSVVVNDSQRDRPLIPCRVFARLLERTARPTNPPPT